MTKEEKQENIKQYWKEQEEKAKVFTSFDYYRALKYLHSRVNIPLCHPQSIVYRVYQYLELRIQTEKFIERHKEKEIIL